MIVLYYFASQTRHGGGGTRVRDANVCVCVCFQIRSRCLWAGSGWGLTRGEVSAMWLAFVTPEEASTFSLLDRDPREYGGVQSKRLRAHPCHCCGAQTLVSKPYITEK